MITKTSPLATPTPTCAVFTVQIQENNISFSEKERNVSFIKSRATKTDHEPTVHEIFHEKVPFVLCFKSCCTNTISNYYEDQRRCHKPQDTK